MSTEVFVVKPRCSNTSGHGLVRKGVTPRMRLGAHGFGRIWVLKIKESEPRCV
jgi:hypothetical protein